MTGEVSGTGVSSVWLLVVFVPLVLAMATAFTKTTITLGAVRIGLGAEALLPMGVVFALALVVTLVIMGPVLTQIMLAVAEAGGVEALLQGAPSAWWSVLEPLRAFVERHAAAHEIEFFAGLQGRPASDPLVLVPAFLVTELVEGFTIAVLIVVPFLAIDLVIAQVVSLMGLFQQPIPLLTLPLKVLLFLSVNGWDTVIGGLVEGYQ